MWKLRIHVSLVKLILNYKKSVYFLINLYSSVVIFVRFLVHVYGSSRWYNRLQKTTTPCFKDCRTLYDDDFNLNAGKRKSLTMQVKGNERAGIALEIQLMDCGQLKSRYIKGRNRKCFPMLVQVIWTTFSLHLLHSIIVALPSSSTYNATNCNVAICGSLRTSCVVISWQSISSVVLG